MKILAERIRRKLELETDSVGHCAIYEDDLQRIWPLDEENRKAKIAQFAKEYGFRLSFYKQDLCAIFEKELSTYRLRDSFKHNLFVQPKPRVICRSLDRNRDGEWPRRSSSVLPKVIVPVPDHHPVGRHLVFHARVVAAHVPVSRDLAPRRLAVRVEKICRVRSDWVVIP